MFLLDLQVIKMIPNPNTHNCFDVDYRRVEDTALADVQSGKRVSKDSETLPAVSSLASGNKSLHNSNCRNSPQDEECFRGDPDVGEGKQEQ